MSVQRKLLQIFFGTTLCWDGHDGGFMLERRNIY